MTSDKMLRLPHPPIYGSIKWRNDSGEVSAISFYSSKRSLVIFYVSAIRMRLFKGQESQISNHSGGVQPDLGLPSLAGQLD